VLRVDELRERRLRGVVPLAGRRLATDVLSGGDDLEVLVLQFSVDLLPAWQIESAPSPGGPGDDERFLATEAGKVHGAAQAIGNLEVGCDA
jgi:hypothetical protein